VPAAPEPVAPELPALDPLPTPEPVEVPPEDPPLTPEPVVLLEDPPDIPEPLVPLELSPRLVVPDLRDLSSERLPLVLESPEIPPVVLCPALVDPEEPPVPAPDVLLCA